MADFGFVVVFGDQNNDHKLGREAFEELLTPVLLVRDRRVFEVVRDIIEVGGGGRRGRVEGLEVRTLYDDGRDANVRGEGVDSSEAEDGESVCDCVD